MTPRVSSTSFYSADGSDSSLRLCWPFSNPFSIVFFLSMHVIEPNLFMFSYACDHPFWFNSCPTQTAIRSHTPPMHCFMYSIYNLYKLVVCSAIWISNLVHPLFNSLVHPQPNSIQFKSIPAPDIRLRSRQRYCYKTSSWFLSHVITLVHFWKLSEMARV